MVGGGVGSGGGVGMVGGGGWDGLVLEGLGWVVVVGLGMG